MKKILLLLFISIQVFAQKKEIMAVMSQQEKHWNEGNIDAFMEGYWVSDSLKFIGKNGVTLGFNATKSRYHASYPNADKMGQLHFDILQIDALSKNSAWVLGKWQLTRPKEGDVGGYFTLVFKKIKGKWLIVSDHTS